MSLVDVPDETIYRFRFRFRITPPTLLRIALLLRLLNHLTWVQNLKIAKPDNA